MHVSTVIKDLCVRQGIFKRDKDAKPGVRGDAETILSSTWMQLGCALEWAIVQRYDAHHEDTGEYVVPRELHVDDLYGSPDLLHLPTMRVREIKLSWMSMNNLHTGEKFWRYWVQLMAYCRMLETQLGELDVTFVNGDWKKVGPKRVLYKARFTMQELKENWRMLTKHADWLRSRGHVGEVHEVEVGGRP